jgi:hypothetical protein
LRVATNRYTVDQLEWDKIRSQGEYPIVMIDNGYYRAVAVAYCEEEFDYFVKHENDGRPKLWFSVPGEILKKAIPKNLWDLYKCQTK